MRTEGDERMNGLNDLSLNRIVEILASKGHEGEYWDYKQEWHDNMTDLLKDTLFVLPILLMMQTVIFYLELMMMAVL